MDQDTLRDSMKVITTKMTSELTNRYGGINEEDFDGIKIVSAFMTVIGTMNDEIEDLKEQNEKLKRESRDNLTQIELDALERALKREDEKITRRLDRLDQRLSLTGYNIPEEDTEE